MKFTKLSIAVLCVTAAATLLLAGCKKDETKFTFEGLPTFQLDEFIQQGEKIVIFPNEVKLSPKDKKTDRAIKMYYMLTKRATNSDTLLIQDALSQGLKIKIPNGDTLCSTSITVYAIADGYTSASATRDFTIIDTTFIGGSISDQGISEDDPHFPDKDGRKYYTTQINGNTWMKHNYAGGNGTPYRNSPAMAILFGKYYTWEEAQSVCPKGWHLSTKSEWDDMVSAFGNEAGSYMVNAKFNITEKFWPYWPNVNITNKSTFSALSTGYASKDLNGKYKFIDCGEYALFWTNGQKDGLGHCKYINVQTTELMDGYYEKTGILASVRCVAD